MLLSRLHPGGSFAMASLCVSKGSIPGSYATVISKFPKRIIQVVRASSELPSSSSGSPQVRLSRSWSSIRAQPDEERAAAIAAVTADSSTPTIFDKIISKELPSTVVYEDDKALAFRDINPQAPVHIVLIPKNRDGLTQLAKADERHKDILGHLLYVAKVVADQEELADGFRVVINDGPNGCQSVYHLHLHILGGRKLKWPPG
ncbi:hypothetical protein R1sor_018334 [Riccia sorocarpa]|uniref:HIT domain-containing protein n=1 Tax=Riccia sorocarpa TaxID=122646 RepID=A0ABD3IC47_9MARC